MLNLPIVSTPPESPASGRARIFLTVQGLFAKLSTGAIIGISSSQVAAGSANISNGTDLVVVTFPSALLAAPSRIDWSVENVSGDVSKQALGGIIVAKTASGFTLKLSAVTNTANYSLKWAAYA